MSFGKKEKLLLYGGLAFLGAILISDYLKKRRAVVADQERAALVNQMNPKLK